MYWVCLKISVFCILKWPQTQPIQSELRVKNCNFPHSLHPANLTNDLFSYPWPRIVARCQKEYREFFLCKTAVPTRICKNRILFSLGDLLIQQSPIFNINVISMNKIQNKAKVLSQTNSRILKQAVVLYYYLFSFVRRPIVRGNAAINYTARHSA